MGVDFSPNSEDTERLIELKFDPETQGKTRLFVFDEDNLDNSQEFIECCRNNKRGEESGPGSSGPTVSGLSGNHLAPVFFKFAVDDLDLGDLPEEARDMAQDAVGGFQSASFGDESDLNALVDEICAWILGKGPSREPRWDSKERSEPLPRSAGSSS